MTRGTNLLLGPPSVPSMGRSMRRALAALALSLVASHAGVASLGCAHAPMPAPRVVLAARITQRASGRHEEVASASLRVPLDAPTHVVGDAPSPPVAFVPSEGVDLHRPYRGEPTIDELLEAAMEGPLYDPERAREARSRARLSGLLPLVRADVRRGSGWDLRTQQTLSNESIVLANDDSWSVLGSVTFRLDRLVFAREEVPLFAEERRLEEARVRLATELVQLYAERRRLQLARDQRGGADLPTEARIAELGAILDVMSRGAMSRAGR